MNAVSNNLAMSNLQIGYNQNHIHGNMSLNQGNHDMSKMNEVAGKEQMKADCNMSGMHGNSNVSSVAKSGTSNEASDSNLGRTIDFQA